MRAPNDTSNAPKRRRFDSSNFYSPNSVPPSNPEYHSLLRTGPSASSPASHPNPTSNYAPQDPSRQWDSLHASASASPLPHTSVSMPRPNGANTSHTPNGSASNADHGLPAYPMPLAPIPGLPLPPLNGMHQGALNPLFAQTVPPGSMPSVTAATTPVFDALSRVHSAQVQGNAFRSSALAARGAAPRDVYTSGRVLQPRGGGEHAAQNGHDEQGRQPRRILSGEQRGHGAIGVHGAHRGQGGLGGLGAHGGNRGHGGHGGIGNGTGHGVHVPGSSASAWRGLAAPGNRPRGGGGASASASGHMPPLRSISPVVDALALLRDDSTIIQALSKLFSIQTNRAMAASMRREQILDFRGFTSSNNPQFQALAALSKSDLDVLAWIFVVSKHGRKDDVARRIVCSLRAPLKYRVPPESRRPHLPERLTGRVSAPMVESSTTSTLQLPSMSQRPSSPLPRSNMPSLAPPTSDLQSNFMLAHLQEQLLQADGSRGVGRFQGNGAPSRGVNAGNRARQGRDALHEMLTGYDFKSPENPFNVPLNAPLGAKNFVVFSSMQLTRGNNDPVLIFPTPRPIGTDLHPEVQGGDVQIQLRCLQVDIEKAREFWKQAWPFPAACRVNGHVVTLNQAQRYTNGKLAGLDTATNITPFLRKYKSAMSESNRVTVRRQSSTATAATGQYVLFAQEILVHSQETMIKAVHDCSEKYWMDYRHGLEEKGLITSETSTFEMARHGVVMFLTDPDGLTVSSMKVSLRCPLALTRIETPVKGKRCQHVQCFDLLNFLEYSRRSSKFDCPVCNKHTADPSMLVVSPYVEYALRNFADCDEVEIFQDGSMVKVERKQTGVASSDDEDDGEGPLSNGGATNTNSAVVVDLTLDSDGDDCSAQPRTSMSGLPPESSSPGAGVGQPDDRSRTNSRGRADETEASSEIQPSQANDVCNPEQDLEFTFQADFWVTNQAGEEMAGGVLRPPPPPANNGSNWPIDVIALDSD